MGTLKETPQWEEKVYELDVTDPVLGGPDGPDNKAARQLANRTAWLKSELEKIGEAVTEVRPIGEVQMVVSPAYNAADYDDTGKGKTGTPAAGWALCNGKNGTADLRGRFAVGADPENVQYYVGATGGAEKVTLTIEEMPAHSHAFKPYKADLAQGDNGTRRTTVDTGYRDNMTTEKAGGSQGHENRPPYYALVYRQRIQN